MTSPRFPTPIISPPATWWARTWVAGACAASLMGCSTPPATQMSAENSPLLSLRMDLPTRLSNTPATPEPVRQAPVVAATPEAPREERFDLVVNSASTRNVFLALVADTRYSMLLHPDVGGTLSVTLKGVTLREALESIRDVYGYDFKMDGRRITIFPPTLQTRLFNVNYLNSQRQGQSDVRVTSGQAPMPTSGNTNNNGSTPSTPSPDQTTQRQDSSQVSTRSSTDLWAEISSTLRTMIGTANGRSVVTSPQAGVIAVRAMPDELRQIESFLKSMRFTVERQVMLEAKILEVELRDGFQSGIDWSILGTKSAIGQASGYPGNPLVGNANGLPTLPTPGLVLATDHVPLPTVGSGILGLSLATKGFDAVLGFLETHGEVQVLSSPRVAAMNNQKAVLKVGSDEFFVTAVQGGSIQAGTGSNGGTATTLPTITLTPFFSGIALDVTPQIDDGGMITLHIHPSVTAVSTVTKQIDLGAVGNYKLPLAYSSVNETDTVVRIPDGNIVAIGGLMQMQANRTRSGLPGTGDNQVTRTLFGNRVEKISKKEIVVLIKPTVIRSTEDWEATALQARDALDRMDTGKKRVISVDGDHTSVEIGRTPTPAEAPAVAAPSAAAEPVVRPPSLVLPPPQTQTQTQTQSQPPAQQPRRYSRLKAPSASRAAASPSPTLAADNSFQISSTP